MWLSVIALLAVSVGLIIWGARNAQVASTVENGGSGLTAAVSAMDNIKGATSTDAVTLVEYSDFECPACGAYAPVVKALMEEYKEEVAFVYRHFPLPQHLSARTAAAAAEAAGKQGRFFEMHDRLFENQKEWAGAKDPKAVIVGYAEELGLNVDQFMADLESDEIAEKVEQDRLSGTTSGVRGTPTFYLNGEQIANPQTPEAFKALLDEAIGTTTAQ